MNIVRVQRFSEIDLIVRLRKVYMLKDKNRRPYVFSVISLESINLNCLIPAQRYVLSDELKKVRDLKWALLEHDVDIFKLDGYVKCWFDGIDEPIDVLPPIVEESFEPNDSVVNIVNDGMHRIYMALLEGITPQVVFIRGVLKSCPYYAYPVPGGWNSVEIVDSLPENYIKKWHRIKNNKTLYRNFNSAFENVGGPRGRTA